MNGERQTDRQKERVMREMGKSNWWQAERTKAGKR